MREDILHAFFALILESGGVVVLAYTYDHDDIVLLPYNCTAQELTESEIAILQKIIDRENALKINQQSNFPISQSLTTDNQTTTSELPTSQNFELLEKKTDDKQKMRKGFFSGLFKR